MRIAGADVAADIEACPGRRRRRRRRRLEWHTEIGGVCHWRERETGRRREQETFLVHVCPHEKWSDDRIFRSTEQDNETGINLITPRACIFARICVKNATAMTETVQEFCLSWAITGLAWLWIAHSRVQGVVGCDGLVIAAVLRETGGADPLTRSTRQNPRVYFSASIQRFEPHDRSLVIVADPEGDRGCRVIDEDAPDIGLAGQQVFDKPAGFGVEPDYVVVDH